METKRTFVRFVSHEIRTPLNVVSIGLDLMKSDMMKSGHADAETIETLTEMQASCETAVNILNDLLSYEKLDAGLLKLDQTMCPVLPMLRELLGPFSIQVFPSALHLALCDICEYLFD